MVAEASCSMAAQSMSLTMLLFRASEAVCLGGVPLDPLTRPLVYRATDGQAYVPACGCPSPWPVSSLIVEDTKTRRLDRHPPCGRGTGCAHKHGGTPPSVGTKQEEAIITGPTKISECL